MSESDEDPNVFPQEVHAICAQGYSIDVTPEGYVVRTRPLTRDEFVAWATRQLGLNS